jgi:hypothetical protein
MDTNFRLKLRNCHIKNDPELSPGWAYCVNEQRYQNEMDQHGDQIEVSLRYIPVCGRRLQLLQISNCDSGLHAIDHANT